MLKYCLLKLAAVMSGVNATNYIFIFQKIITLSLTFVSLFIENQAFCCTVLFGMYCLNKYLNMFVAHIKSNVRSVMTHTPETRNAELAGFYYGGEIIDREIYSRLRPKLPLFSAIIIPSKVIVILLR